MTARTVLLLLGLLAAAPLGCRRKVPPEQTVDGWKLAREALTSGEHCFAGRAEYCLTDPAFVDDAIRRRLDELYGGEMPARRVHVDAVIRAAAIRYKRETMRPENLTKVEELVKERYLNPKVTVEADTVSVDMGVVPGPLEGRPVTLALTLVGSEMLDDGEWKRSEIDRVLGGLVDKHPDKRVLRAVVTVPTARGMGALSYRYLREERTLVVTDWQGQMRTSKRLSGPEALQDPATKVRFFDLEPCEPSRLAAPPDQDPPRVCPPDVDPTSKAPP
jgi:hypothetical protein